MIQTVGKWTNFLKILLRNSPRSPFIGFNKNSPRQSQLAMRAQIHSSMRSTSLLVSSGVQQLCNSPFNQTQSLHSAAMWLNLFDATWSFYLKLVYPHFSKFWSCVSWIYCFLLYQSRCFRIFMLRFSLGFYIWG